MEKEGGGCVKSPIAEALVAEQAAVLKLVFFCHLTLIFTTLLFCKG